MCAWCVGLGFAFWGKAVVLLGEEKRNHGYYNWVTVAVAAVAFRNLPTTMI